MIKLIDILIIKNTISHGHICLWLECSNLLSLLLFSIFSFGFSEEDGKNECKVAEF